VRLTSLARIFLQLRGKDAVRWLLTLEVSLSHGSQDRWRISREALAEASSARKLVRWMNPQGDEAFPYAPESLVRAVRLGVFEAWAPSPDDEIDAYTVRDEFREVVASVVEPGPWHLAIRALLDDERGAVVPLATMPPSATEAVIAQARMMAHEVRNALVPARHHLDALLDVGDAHRPRVEKARRGVVRVLEFVDQLVATADLVTEPHTRCLLTEVFADACDRVETGDRVRLSESTAVPLLHAPRQRLVIALANLIQNALQVATAPSPVQLSWAAVGDELQIRVDDGGPGVAPADRIRIFDDGYTTRPGGSGYGLAYVRKVVESSFRGRVWCEESDLGGARFVIAIPTKAP
jgi:signal transduction histidine kinase